MREKEKAAGLSEREKPKEDELDTLIG